MGAMFAVALEVSMPESLHLQAFDFAFSYCGCRRLEESQTLRYMARVSVLGCVRAKQNKHHHVRAAPLTHSRPFIAYQSVYVSTIIYNLYNHIPTDVQRMCNALPEVYSGCSAEESQGIAQCESPGDPWQHVAALPLCKGCKMLQASKLTRPDKRSNNGI